MKRYLALILTLCGSIPLFAQFPEPMLGSADGLQTTARLEASSTHIVPGEPLELAVVLEMQNHWHTYWRNPGGPGQATEIEWDLPEGLTAGDIQWPVPEWITYDGTDSFGYEGQAPLLIPVEVSETFAEGGELTLKATVYWIECKDVCIPGQQDITLTLPVGTAGTPNPEFEAYRNRIPQDVNWGVKAVRTAKGLRITVEMPEDAADAAQYFPGAYGVWQLDPAPALTRQETELRIDLTLLEGFERPESVNGLLVLEDGTAVRINGKVGAISAAPAADGAATESTRATWYYLGVAFLAGIGMNLLPCIFPVLGLKISSFVEQAHGDRSSIRTHALVFAAGVLVSMWVVAAFVAVFGAAWGAQFQDPRLVIGMLLVLTFFTMNLFGVFEMGLGLTTVGGNLTGKQGYAGSFFQGILLTVIGTPCTGPILVLVIAWMLAQPLWIGFLAFTLMGLGLASPYVLLAFSPPLLDRLPPPGNWMVTFKKASAFAMVAFLWVLLYVLRKQIPVDGLIQVIGSALLICFSAWILGTWDTAARKTFTRIVAKTLAGLLLLFAIYTAYTYRVPATELNEELQARIESGAPIRWTDVTPELAEKLLADDVPVHYLPWSPERVQELLSEGRPVFVDFTAEWCTICKQNKARALHQDDVMRAFAEKEVVTLRADWTARDPVIAERLSSLGRRGVPVYLLYDGKGNQPRLLPESLSPEIIQDALDEL